MLRPKRVRRGLNCLARCWGRERRGWCGGVGVGWLRREDGRGLLSERGTCADEMLADRLRRESSLRFEKQCHFEMRRNEVEERHWLCLKTIRSHQ